MRNGVRTICFTKSRRSAELIYQQTADRLEGDRPSSGRPPLSLPRGLHPRAAAGHRGARCSAASLLAVVSTNALELGIDIGALDAVITVGYPGTVASLWQQWGRAGRGKGESLGIFVAGNDALEQFFVKQPGRAAHPRGGSGHHRLRQPLHPRAPSGGRRLRVDLSWPTTSAFFGPGWPTPPTAGAADGFCAPGATPGTYSGAGLPGRGDRAALVHRRTSSPSWRRTPATSSAPKEAETAFSFLHPGAVYLHMGETYLVTDLDIDGRVAVVRRFCDTYYTQAAPGERHATSCGRTCRIACGPLSLHLGDDGGHQPGGRLPEEATGWRRGAGHRGTRPAHPGVRHRGHVVHHPSSSCCPARATCCACPGPSTPSSTPSSPSCPCLPCATAGTSAGCPPRSIHQTEQPTIFVYDGHAGGVGISRQGFDRFEEWARDAHALIRDCPCEAGCPSCIQSPKCGNWNEPLDKELARSLLEAMLC